MQLLVTLAILHSVAASRMMWPLAEGALDRQVGATMLFVVAPWVVATSIRQRGSLFLSERRPFTAATTATRLRLFVPRAVWFMSTLLIAWAADWSAVVRGPHGLNLAGIPIVDDAMTLGPLVVSLLGLWWFEAAATTTTNRATPPQVVHGRDVSYGAQWHAVANSGSENSTRIQWVAQNARQFLLIPIAPVLGLLAGEDLARWLWPDATEAAISWFVLTPLLVITALLLPELVCVAWNATPLPDGVLRNRLLRLAVKRGISLKDVLYWPTGRRSANAAVVGFLAPWRYVFLSDRLIDALSEDEVVAIFAHELGHLERRHLAKRVSALVAPALATLFIGQLCPFGTRISASGYPLLPLPVWIEFLLALAAAASALWLLGHYAKRLEYEADWSGCAILAKYDANSANKEGRLSLLSTAVVRMATALAQLDAVAGGDDRETWLHPATRRRIAEMERRLLDANVS